MAITIKNEEVELLVREVAREERTSLTEAVHTALKGHLAQIRGRRREPVLLETLLTIGARCAALPDLDQRSAEDILDYNADGVFCHGG